MAQSRAVRTASRRKRRRSARIASVWPVVRSARRALRALLVAPLGVRVLVGAVVVLAVWLAVNWLYQVARKPTELFFPVSGALSKAPPETWRQYGSLFHRHSTSVITPDLLAALAQVEGSGNPVARTSARWRPRRQPLPCACQRAETTVRPAGRRRVANRFPTQDVGPPAFLASGVLICQNRRG